MRLKPAIVEPYFAGLFDFPSQFKRTSLAPNTTYCRPIVEPDLAGLLDERGVLSAGRDEHGAESWTRPYNSTGCPLCAER
jgi:hypothetical protein